MNLKLTDNELSIVCEAIACRMGLDFPVEKWGVLRRNLVTAAKELGFHNTEAFIRWLKSDEPDDNQIEILASNLTVSETYFWREPPVFDALTDFIVPELIKRRHNNKIRIWSAGCSSGEEPYSVAIALHKSVPQLGSLKVNILATDINAKALSKAKEGEYTPWSFRNATTWLRDIYFKRTCDNKFIIKPEIKKMVTFSYFNLRQEDYLSTICDNEKMDIIFCRNVLMYLTDEVALRVKDSIYDALSDDGWLIVSPCELSSQIFHEFKPVNFPGAVLYKKSPKNPTHSEWPDLSFFNNMIKDDDLVTEKRNVPLYTSQTIPPKSLEAKIEKEPAIDPAEELGIKNISGIRDLANNGYLDEALKECNKTISSNKLYPELYFLKASIQQEMNNDLEAVRSLKQAIYLDPDYVMGHFFLGNIFMLQGKSVNAKRHFNNALGLLKNRPEDDILPDAEGLSVKYIRELITGNVNVI